MLVKFKGVPQMLQRICYGLLSVTRLKQNDLPKGAKECGVGNTHIILLDVDDVQRHVTQVIKMTNKQECAYCSLIAVTECNLCLPACEKHAGASDDFYEEPRNIEVDIDC